MMWVSTVHVVQHWDILCIPVSELVSFTFSAIPYRIHMYIIVPLQNVAELAFSKAHL